MPPMKTPRSFDWQEPAASTKMDNQDEREGALAQRSEQGHQSAIEKWAQEYSEETRFDKD